MRKPEHAIVVTTFKEFRDDIQAFADGKYQFLLVIGNNGLSKTETVSRAVEQPLVIEGEPTAWQLYKDLYDNLDATLIFDDVATKFYRDSKTLSYLKKLTETKRVKTLRWPTNSAGEGKKYPSSFQTTTCASTWVIDAHPFCGIRQACQKTCEFTWSGKLSSTFTRILCEPLKKMMKQTAKVSSSSVSETSENICTSL